MTVYYADTANLKELKDVRPLVRGCTTNPLIMAKEGVQYSPEIIQNIARVIPWHVSVELTSEDPEQMIEEAKKYRGWGDGIERIKNPVVIKVPIQSTTGRTNLDIVSLLSEEGIPTNVTCCMTPGQMYGASQAGATYASIFWGRVADQGYDPVTVVQEIVEQFKQSGTKTQIIVGSLRQVLDVTYARRTGADILTVTPDVLKKTLHHPRSIETQREFIGAYEKLRMQQEKV
ncbi:hypothetical protein HY483_00670 [Candidatus Woesearchaeota archaeon]|nr:hypothetical protein [Candidatus Woesearchaeota archaeon]